ncbi:MAG: hypothetical protein GTO02_03900 [Candidatus Dadabacteria bacterium]|nr:hypothetical protein [Candidatus Dadabacteria bacterium]NIQ13569.1 hypothetical protein [Candidatus Dadabacteria bacterium]
MHEIPNRYIAEIETPDGIETIDCEITKGTKTKLSFILNISTFSTGDIEKYPDFRKQLHKNNEIVLETDRTDLKKFIEDILYNAYGDGADISIKEIDFD